jgi:hypothetical protein
MRPSPTSASLVLFLALAGCDSDPPSESGSDAGSASIGTITAGDSSGSASAETSAGDASMSGSPTTDPGQTSGDASSGGVGGTDDGPKFDVPDSPDTGSGGCTDGGGSGGGGGTAFSNIWVANAPQGTVSKIDTESALEVARYRTTTDASNEPSRTSVNQFGDIAAGHRYAARVVKIAAQPEDCIDINGNGIIDTSTAADDIRDFGTDECLIWETDLPPSSFGTRAVAWEGGTIDPATCENTNQNPRLWVAYGSNPLQVYRLDGATGAQLDTTTIASSGFVYGGAVNADGDFWVSDRSGLTLSRVDADDLSVTTFTVPGSNAYGMGVDGDGQPWFATYSGGAGVDFIYRFDPITQTFFSAGGVTGRYRGLAIDREDRVWVAGNSPCRLAVFDRLNDNVINDAIELPGCSDPVGVTIDRDGFVWVVDRGASVAWKVDPVAYTIVATVTGLTSPYTYSDFSGSGLDLVINPPG